MSEERKLRIGFVGCGNHATNCIYPSLRMAPIDLVAVCDLDENLRERNGRNFGARRTYADYRKMLDAEELDALFLVTGPKVHPALSIEAMERGLDVWMEKPPALDSGTAREILAASEKTGRRVGVGFMKRFATGYQMAKEIGERPEFGGPVMLHMNFASGSYESREIFFNDFPIHHLDLARFFLGEVKSLVAFPSGKAGVEAAVAVVMNFQSGAVASATFTSLHGWGNPAERIELIGSGEYVVVDNVHKVTHYRKAEKPWEEHSVLSTETDPVTWEPNWMVPDTTNSSLYHTGYINEMRAFADAVLEDKPFRPDITDGIRSLEMVEALQKSNGTLIEL